MPAALLALLVAATPVASPGVRAEVRALLGAFERPPPAESFRRFGAEGETALADLALSRDLPPLRARALQVLAALRSPRAEEVHRTVAAAADAPSTVRRAAVRGLGQLLPADRALASLRPLLERDGDPRVRSAAAEALSTAAPAGACGAIRAQAAREDAAGVARFRRALESCGRAR